MERLADAMVDRVLDVAPTRLVELELGVEKELVRQLLIGQTTGERRVRTDSGRHRSHRPTRSAVLVEISESLDTCNLLQLGLGSGNRGFFAQADDKILETVTKK